MDDLTLLRLYLGERVPIGGTDADTFFTDDELNGLLLASEYGVEGAAVIGWAVKAGEFARLIDINESGGDRKLSQKFRNANTQLQYYQGLVETKIANSTAVGRVGPKSIDWAGMGEQPGIVMYRNQFHRMPYWP
jgi:hypothetical protein